MGKQVKKYGYSWKLERVVDGDTCDALIDLGFNSIKFLYMVKFIQFYEKSLKINTNDYEMLCNIGFHITQMGGYENAIKYFDRVLSTEPSNPVAINGKNLALGLQKLSSEEQAELVRKSSTEYHHR